MIIDDLLPFTAAQAAEQQVILAAEIAVGQPEPPPEDWQLAALDFCPPAELPPLAATPGSGGRVPVAFNVAPAAAAADCGPTGLEHAGAGSAESEWAKPGWVDPIPCGILVHDPHAADRASGTQTPGGADRAGSAGSADGTDAAGGAGAAAGAGFGSGSVLDTLAPGLVLSAALEDAEAAGLAQLGEDELAGVILAWRRTESRALAGLLAAVADLHRRRMNHPDLRVDEFTDSELAILLTLGERAAAGLLGQADALTRLPATRAALRAGRIDRNKLAVIVFETALLDDTVAAAVEQLIIDDAPRQTPARLRQRLRAAVQAADPDAVRRRKAKAAKDARVELQSEQSGNAQLAGRELPPVAALAADARIDAAARALKAAGVKARLTQLRAAVFLALLTGADPLTFLPDTDDNSPPGSDAPASGNGPGASDDPPARPGPRTASPPPGPGPGASDDPPARPGPRTASPPPDTSRTDPRPDRGPDATSRRQEDPGNPAKPRTPTGPPPRHETPGALAVDGSVHLTVSLDTWQQLMGASGEIPGHGPVSTSAGISPVQAGLTPAPRTARQHRAHDDPADRAIADSRAARPPPSNPDQHPASSRAPSPGRGRLTNR